MDHVRIRELVNCTSVPCTEATRQKQWHQIRFFGIGTDHSLNLGYSMPEGVFFADFVFKHFDRDTNGHYCAWFSRLFKGEIRDKTTVFCRLKIPFNDEARLLRIIQRYWAIQL